MKLSPLIATVTSFECFEIAEVPRGEYCRNAAYGSLEGNGAIELRRDPCREGVEELLDGPVGQDVRPVVEHLGGPREGRVLRHRLRKEQGLAQPERLPALGERAARVPRLDDDRRVRDEGHRPIPEREVLPLDRVAGWELRNREMVPHDLILKSGILPREDLVEGGPKDCNRAPAAVDCGHMGGGVDSLGEPAHDHDPTTSQETGELRGPAESLGARLPGAHDRYPGALPQDAGIAGDVEGLWSMLLLHLVHRAEKVLGRYALIAHSLNYRPFHPILALKQARSGPWIRRKPRCSQIRTTIVGDVSPHVFTS